MRLYQVFQCPPEEWDTEDEFGIVVHGDLPGQRPEEVVFDLEFPNMRTAFRFIERFESDFIYRYDVTNSVDGIFNSVTFTITFHNPNCQF